MTLIRNVNIKSQDSPSIDAFGRWRVSNPVTIFDSKQLYDNLPTFWDDAETSGSGTGTAYSANEAATTISVGATTAGKRVRQTFMRFNYQPGKSQLVKLSWGEFDTLTGITKEVGQFDDDNGIFFRSSEGVLSVVIRSNYTGSPVDNAIIQTNWNLDTLDGNGPSGITLDLTKAQIGIIDYEWLGVGRVRMGFVINGVIYYCHEFNHANLINGVYMSTPNLPLRYSIENDGTGAADDFVHICSSIISEGGQESNGQIWGVNTGTTHLDADTADTKYALIGLRLKSTHLGAGIDLLGLSALAETNDNFKWELLLNPTVAGTFTYSDVGNSALQAAYGVTANTVSGGDLIDSGFVSSDIQQERGTIQNARRLGAAIDGTRDELVLAITPFGANLDVHGAINWREIL